MHEERALHREGHALMLRRLYRVMIKEVDPIDCERCISEDWERDTKGKGELTGSNLGVGSGVGFGVAVSHTSTLLAQSQIPAEENSVPAGQDSMSPDIFPLMQV